MVKCQLLPSNYDDNDDDDDFIVATAWGNAGAPQRRYSLVTRTKTKLKFKLCTAVQSARKPSLYCKLIALCTELHFAPCTLYFALHYTTLNTLQPTLHCNLHSTLHKLQILPLVGPTWIRCKFGHRVGAKLSVPGKIEWNGIENMSVFVVAKWKHKSVDIAFVKPELSQLFPLLLSLCSTFMCHCHHSQYCQCDIYSPPSSVSPPLCKQILVRKEEEIPKCALGAKHRHRRNVTSHHSFSLLWQS